MPDWKHPFDPHYPPPGPHPGGPYPPPPPGPMPVPPDAPRFLAPGGPPPYPLMPPAPSVVEGESLYEAVNDLTDRVNVCINTYNDVMAECYKTLANLQRAAEENGAYYGPSEVWVEEGYDADSAAAYSVIHKRAVDRRGEPIFMQLGLAYDNASNSKIEQSIFSASKIKFADKIVVAQPKTADGWYGKAIWHGSPIQSAVKGDLWTVGFTRNGIMRVYSNGTGVDQMIRDTVVDAMGVSGVVIQDGAITSETYYQNIPNYDVQCARVLMGQNTNTGEVMILTTGAENDVNRKGMTTIAAANLLLQRGCNIAVELCEGADAGACDKGSMMFIPDNDTVPTAYCFWYISRRRFYKNDYERELAMLTQNYGQCIWDGYLNARNIQNFSDKLAEEIERAQNAENNLDQKITTETERAKAAEAALDAKIEAETDRAEAEEARLDAKIDAETERAEGVEANLQEQITAEVARATGEEERIEGKLDDEIERAKSAEAAIQTALNDEINRAKLEEQRLDGAIKTEEQARKDEDARLNTAIQNEQQAREDADTALGGRIDALSTSVTEQITQFKTEVEGKLNEMETNISELATDVSTLTNQVNSLSQNVTEMTSTISTLTSQVNAVQEQLTTVTGDIVDLNEAIDKIQSGDMELPYIKNNAGTYTGGLSGDTLTLSGAINAAGGAFSGAVTVPVTPNADAEATSKAYVDAKDAAINSTIENVNSKVTAVESEVDNIQSTIEQMQSGDVDLPYLPLAGGTVTGPINYATAPAKDAELANKAYVDAQDAATLESAKEYSDTNLTAAKEYTDTADASILQQAKDYADSQTGTVEGDVSAVTGRVDALETSQTQQDAEIANLKNGTTELPYLKLSGGTMSGPINYATAPAQDAELANKKYVDDQNAATLTSSKAYTDEAVADMASSETIQQIQQDIANIENGTTNLPYLPLSGGNLSGDLSINGTPVATDSDLDNYVPKSGGTITGPIYYSGEPSQSSELVNKAYVDAHAGQVSGPTGHAEFVDAFRLDPNASKTITKNSDDIYLITVYSTFPHTNTDTLAWYKQGGQATVGSVDIDPMSDTSATFSDTTSASNGTNVVTIYKFVSDGEQPEPVAPTYDELNLTVLTKTTNGETTASDHNAAMAAMEAAASGAFHYKLNGDIYVISTTALNGSSAKAENVWYCVGEKWYDGTNTLVFESSDYSSNAYWTTNTTSVLNYDASTDYTGADALKNLIQNHYTDTTYHYKLTNGSYTPIYICTNTKIDANTISADNSYFVLTSPNNVVYAGSVKFKEVNPESQFTLVEGIECNSASGGNTSNKNSLNEALNTIISLDFDNYYKVAWHDGGYIYFGYNGVVNSATSEIDGAAYVIDSGGLISYTVFSGSITNLKFTSTGGGLPTEYLHDGVMYGYVTCTGEHMAQYSSPTDDPVFVESKNKYKVRAYQPTQNPNYYDAYIASAYEFRVNADNFQYKVTGGEWVNVTGGSISAIAFTYLYSPTMNIYYKYNNGVTVTVDTFH